MNAVAIIMMLVTVLLVWGGLVASLVMLRLLPTPDDNEEHETLASQEAEVLTR